MQELKLKKKKKKSHNALTIFFYKHLADRLANSTGSSKHRLLIWAPSVFIFNDVILLYLQLIGTVCFYRPSLPIITSHTMGQKKKKNLKLEDFNEHLPFQTSLIQTD